MKVNELKKVLKPLIKECIKEVIFEDGTLSGIITEVAKGLSGASINAPTPLSVAKPKNNFNQLRKGSAIQEAKKQLEETKKSLQESTGLKGVFEGTTPIHSSGGSQKHGALRDRDPGDSGVDISGIMSVAGDSWKQLK
jgi:hypothetical protein